MNEKSKNFLKISTLSFDKIYIVPIQNQRSRIYLQKTERSFKKFCEAIIDQSQKIKIRLEPFFYGICRVFDIDVEVELHSSVIEGDFKTTNRTLSKYSQRRDKTSINKFDESGRTCLSNAIILGNLDIVRILLEAPGIDVNIKDQVSNYAPLHHACYISSVPIIQLLLQIDDANVNIETDNKLTPLMKACEIGNNDVVALLIKIGNADPEKCDKEGWNSLFYAAYSGNIQTVQYLLDIGVDKDTVDINRFRAVDWARHNGHGDVVSLLEKYVCQVSM